LAGSFILLLENRLLAGNKLEHLSEIQIFFWHGLTANSVQLLLYGRVLAEEYE
jgi:hypothetical protein